MPRPKKKPANNHAWRRLNFIDCEVTKSQNHFDTQIINDDVTHFTPNSIDDLTTFLCRGDTTRYGHL